MPGKVGHFTFARAFRRLLCADGYVYSLQTVRVHALAQTHPMQTDKESIGRRPFSWKNVNCKEERWKRIAEVNVASAGRRVKPNGLTIFTECLVECSFVREVNYCIGLHRTACMQKSTGVNIKEKNKLNSALSVS